MKKFAIFGGGDIYARGGFKDLIGTVDNLIEVTPFLNTIVKAYQDYVDSDFEYEKTADSLSWWQVVDLHTGEILIESEIGPYGCNDGAAKSFSIEYLDGALRRVEPLTTWEGGLKIERKTLEQIATQEALRLGWTRETRELYDEEGVEGWAWISPEGTEHTEIGNHDNPPELFDHLIINVLGETRKGS